MAVKSNTYVQCDLGTLDGKTLEWSGGQVSNGLQDKLITLKEIIAAGSEGDEQKAIKRYLGL